MTQEALKLALEALEQTLQTLDDENSKPGGAIADTIWHTEHETLFDYLGSEITSIKEALAEQPEQEPVAWQFFQGGKWHNGMEFHDHRKHTIAAGTPVRNLYTTPPQRKPLTREQEIALREGYCEDAESSYFGARADCIDTPQNHRLFGAGFDRGWQAAHGIKENT